MLTMKISHLSHSDQVVLFDYWRIWDTVEDFSATFEEGTIIAIVGGLGHGGWLVSSILCGRIDDECITKSVLISGEPATQAKLRKISCYVGEGVAEIPYRKLNTYPGWLKRKICGIKTVKERINQGLIQSNNNLSLNEIAEMFELSGLENKNGRINRPLEFQSGEVWRASMAIGMAYQKKLFCVPWLEPEMLKYVLSDYNVNYINKLRAHGATVIIPVSDERYVQGIADQIIYLKKPKIHRWM